MKVISFHLRGKMAHFRKYYSNSSALSYFIPPRTTICGIVAGLIGLDRDRYYEDFSLDKCKIAITSRKPMKKTMQKLNYLMVKSINDLNGSQEHHSQTPVELIIPQDIRNDYLDYKIWIFHKDKSIMNKLEEVFLKEDLLYYKSLGACLGLGTAFNLGWMELDCIHDGKEENVASKEFISSSIPIEKINELKITSLEGNEIKLIKEVLPLEFDKDRYITIRGLKDILINASGDYIPAVINSFVRLDNGENIAWME